MELRERAHRCFICGPNNPIGLKLRFSGEADGGVAAEFVAQDAYIGYDGLIHGGLLAAVMDDAMANIWAWRGEAAVVGRIGVRFRLPVRPGDRLRVHAVPVGRRRAGVHKAEATISRGDELVADADGLVLVGERAGRLTRV